jgi:2-C-methyl-D-erythritol 4-phosphate cytidylyltransferase
MLLVMCGYKVILLPGDETNIKITYATDIMVADHNITNDDEFKAMF